MRASAGLLVVADGKRGDVPHTAAAYGQALLGRHRDAVGRGARPGRRRGHGQPAAGPRRPGADRGRRARGAGPACSCSCAPRIPARPRSRTTRPEEGRRCVTASPRWSHELGARRRRRARALRRGRGGRGDRAALLAELRARCRTPCCCCPGVGAQGGRVEDLAPAFAAGRAAALVTVSRSIAGAALDAGDAAAALPAARGAARRRAWAMPG